MKTIRIIGMLLANVTLPKITCSWNKMEISLRDKSKYLKSHTQSRLLIIQSRGF